MNFFSGSNLLRQFARLLGRTVWPKSLPPQRGRLEVAGLKQSVKTYRDQWGVPHIFAETWEDAFRAQGFFHAADRLWQMELTRRLFSGRLAEVIGNEPLYRPLVGVLVGKKTLDVDIFMHTFQFRRAAELSWEACSPEARTMVEAYTQGVNGWLRRGKKALPPEIRLLGYEPAPWHPVDTVLISKAIAFELNFSWRSQLVYPLIARKAEEMGFPLEALLPWTGEVAPHILQAVMKKGRKIKDPLRLHEMIESFTAFGGMGAGSNNWVVDGTMTRSGRPILCNDPHLLQRVPGPVYENYLECRGEFLAGGTLPGFPGIQFGRNQRIAWGATALMADESQIFSLAVNDANPGQYRYGNDWKAFETETVEIPIKGAPSPTLTLRRSHHGPVISAVVGDEEPGRVLAWNSPTGGASKEMDGFWKIFRADNWEEFREAASCLSGPHLNMVYADVDGNIGYQAAGTFPLRSSPPTPGFLDGSDPAQDPGRTIPFEALPHAFNPDSHYFATANNKVVDDTYPYYLSVHFEPPYRAGRLHQLLKGRTGLGPRDMADIQLDVKSLFAEEFMREVMRPFLSKARFPDPLSAQAAKVLLQWDSQCSQDSIGAALFHTFHYHLLRNTFLPWLGEDLYRLYTELLNQYVIPTLHILKSPESPFFRDRSREELLLTTWTQVVGWFKAGCTEDISRWTWGAVHQMTWFHPFEKQPLFRRLFNIGPYPVRGDGFTPHLSKSLYAFGPTPLVAAGYRMIVDLSERGESESVLPTGQSGNVLSPHYDDQNSLWREGKLHRFPGDPGVVQRRNVLVLVPSQ